MRKIITDFYWMDRLTLMRWEGEGYTATTAEAMLSEMLLNCINWCFQIRDTLLSVSLKACSVE